MTRTSIYLISGALALLSPLGVQAQSSNNNGNVASTMEKINKRTVKGTVLDEAGEPLIGATVMIEGTTVGVATDLEGNFSLLSPKNDPTIVISYVGMETVKLFKFRKFNLLISDCKI